MSKIFQYKDFPFLLSLLFAVLGYQLNSISNNLLSSPSIEYNIADNITQAGKNLVYKDNICTITNLTHDKSFEQLTINISSNKSSSVKLYDEDLVAVKPSSLHYDSFSHVSNVLLIYNINKLQPGFQYQLRYKSTNDINDKNPSPDLYLTTKDTVRLVEGSPITWVIKNYTFLSFLLCIIWAVIIIIYLIRLKPVI